MHGLVSLPALRSLSITLASEEEEESVFMNLPSARRGRPCRAPGTRPGITLTPALVADLTQLNGLALDDEIEEEEEEKERGAVAPQWEGGADAGNGGAGHSGACCPTGMGYGNHGTH